MESRDDSTTPNSMAVLDRGAGGISTVVGSPTASRPPSGRRSRNMTPIQRSGSQLEVLPPDDEPIKDRSGSRTSSRTSHRPSSRTDSADDNSPRQTQSAGSSGRRSRQGQEGNDAGFNRANSLVGLASASPTPGESRPGSTIHKQVSLTTVKRNYETHGIPKNENWDFVPEDIARLTPPLTNGTSHTHLDKNKTLGATGGLSHKAEGVIGVGANGGNGDGVNVMSEKERTEQRLNYLMEQLSMKDKEIKQHEERRKSGSAAKRKDKDPSSTMSNSYYVSTGGQAEMNPANEPGTSKGATAGPPPFLEDSRDDKPDKTKMDDDEDDGDEDDDEEEGPTAPIELMGEFLDSVMEEDYETADKLCKMILIYEPENAECLQFKPLIEEMLKRMWHRQLYGSSSEDESGEDDEDDDDEDEEDDEDEDSDEEEESSESDSSEESEDEEEEETEEKTTSSSVVYPSSSETSKSGAIR
eukprot:XP_011670256.1 PREDICTED: glutamate-rich protein 2 isoform X2 [Strongylocentrotus purpuratus]